MKQSHVLRLWAPLEMAWLLMALEGPFTAAVIARLSEPTLNLAAYGVSFPLAMFFESPIIMMMSASVALVHDRSSYEKLKRFAFAMNALITLALLLFLLPPLFHRVTGQMMDLPLPVRQLAHRSLLWLLPWPAAIGYRRFYQGILIKQGLTRRVAYGTAIRLMALVLVAALFTRFSTWPGAWVAGICLSSAVVAEAMASRFWARGCVQSLRDRVTPDNAAQTPLTYRTIIHFYTPLALTALLGMGTHPLLSFFISHSAMPIESLAVMPVIYTFLFLFTTVGFTFQEVTLALASQGEEARKVLYRTMWLLAGCSSGIMALVVFSPLRHLWFRGLLGLSPTLAALTFVPTAILCIQPALTVYNNRQRGLLMCAKQTRPVSWATLVEVSAMMAMGFTLMKLRWIGVYGAACSLVFGRIATCLTLLHIVRRLFPSPRHDPRNEALPIASVDA